MNHDSMLNRRKQRQRGLTLKSEKYVHPKKQQNIQAFKDVSQYSK